MSNISEKGQEESRVDFMEKLNVDAKQLQGKGFLGKGGL